MRRAARVDANQAAIVAALRQVGCYVQDLSGVGRGCPDLLVGYRGVWHVIEVKDGRKPPSARELTAAEFAWHEEASRYAPVGLVESVEQALAQVGATRGAAERVAGGKSSIPPTRASGRP